MAIPKNYPDITTPLSAEFLLDYCHPIGEVFFTENLTFDPNVEWGGTWELDEDGVVYGSKSSTNDSPFNVNIGTIIGEDKHTLTVQEMPSHTHTMYNRGRLLYWDATLNNVGLKQGTGADRPVESTWNDGTSTTGNDQPHNNIQKTRICKIWRRIA